MVNMTINVKRFDKRLIGNNVKETAQGFLVIPAQVARTGTQSYRRADGSIQIELRPEPEVFSEQSMASLRTAAVTNRHPVKMVTPDSAEGIIVGHTDGVIWKEDDGDESFLVTNLVITHQTGIDSIKNGRMEISLGYDVDLDFSPGVHNGVNYDAVQRNIINNHIALVDRGRAGNARLRLDENDAESFNNNDEESNTMKIKLGTKEFDVNDEVGNAFKEEIASKEKAKADADLKIAELEKKDADMKAMSKKCDELEVEKTKAIAKADSLESELSKVKTERKDESEIAKLVDAKIALIGSASKFLKADELEKVKNLDSVEIKRAVVRADSANVDEEKLKNPSYVDARFDHIVESTTRADEQNKAIADAALKAREAKKDSVETDDSEKSRKDSMEADKKASMEPIGKRLAK